MVDNVGRKDRFERNVRELPDPERRQSKKRRPQNVSMQFKAARHFTSKYDVSSSTLRRWADGGFIRAVRSGARRLYEKNDVLRRLGVLENDDEGRRLDFIYARVSSSKQRGDLERQVDDLKKAYPRHHVISDIASGVNFKRKGLRSLLDKSIKGMVGQIVVAHRDRLARLGFDLLEFVFEATGARIVVHSRSDEDDGERDLADDLLAVTTLFVASHHGRRAAKNRKRRREESEKTEDDPRGRNDSDEKRH